MDRGARAEAGADHVSTSPPVGGKRVTIERTTADSAAELADLDWLRSLHPAMAGPLVRSAGASVDSAYLVRSVATDEIIAVLDAMPLAGYSGVANVSIYADATRARGAWALDGYWQLVVRLFDEGVRLIHHEVLELNRPLQRVLRAIGVEPSARLRDHAYAAGRFWDVYVYAYDKPTLDALAKRARTKGHGDDRA